MRTEQSTSDVAPPVRRDADNTRRLLVTAARRRFARDGYGATTVRAIAADAGVNVALINRYFGSKEGLFEACMQRTVEQMGPDADTETGETDLDGTIRNLVARVAESPNGDDALLLLLLLRSSGDERAEHIRRTTLHSFAARMALIAARGGPVTEELVLRGQIALATVLGVVVMRTSGSLDALTAAGTPELAAPLDDLFRAVLEHATIDTGDPTADPEPTTRSPHAREDHPGL